MLIFRLEKTAVELYRSLAQTFRTGRGELIQQLTRELFSFETGGVCWTMSELSLNTIQTPNDAKLLRNFADGSRAKIFRGSENALNPSNFCPLAERILQNFLCRFFQFLKFITPDG
jgi:hypothetical protein